MSSYVMVDYLPSHVTPSRQYASHLKVRGTSSKMNVQVGSHGVEDTCSSCVTQIDGWFYESAFFLMSYLYFSFQICVKHQRLVCDQGKLTLNCGRL